MLTVNREFAILCFSIHGIDYIKFSIRIQFMNNLQFQERYSRQIRLPRIGEEGQQTLSSSRVLVVGMGGLGSPVALYLAAAGVGRIQVADFDRVDESNLQRQIVHNHGDIGELKAESAARTMRDINPAIDVEAINYSLDIEDFMDLARDVDLLVDCTDNFPTRFELNDVSLDSSVPLVSGAAIRWEGQVTAFDPRDEASPCYQCLYPDRNIESATCEMEGVVAPLVGVIGTMQAMEAINILLGDGQLHGVVWLFDAQSMEWQRMVLNRNPRCPACSNR
jgi:adenylyltransferase/sulfurtransferase